MKLSLKFKLGHVHVGGGRVLTVVTPHPVSTATRSSHAERPETDRYRPKDAPPVVEPKGAHVIAEVGDLAIEVVYAKTGKLVGYSYLTGPAIQLIRYVDDDGARWFSSESVNVNRLDLPGPEGFASRQAYWEAMIPTVSAARLGSPAVHAFEISVPSSNPDAAADVADVVVNAWAMVPKEVTDEELKERCQSHLVGLVHAGKGVAEVHLQPPRHASDWNATGFQIALVLDALVTGRCRRSDA